MDNQIKSEKMYRLSCETIDNLVNNHKINITDVLLISLMMSEIIEGMSKELGFNKKFVRVNESFKKAKEIFKDV